MIGNALLVRHRTLAMLATVFAFVTAMLGMLTPQAAYAAPVQDKIPDRVSFYHHRRMGFYDFGAPMTNDGNISHGGSMRTVTQTGREGFCAAPSYCGPTDYVSYSTLSGQDLINTIGRDKYELLRAIAWFSYGSEGYDQSIWPVAPWTPAMSWDGDPMDATAWRYIAQHLLIGHVLGVDGNVFLGLNGSHSDWFRTNVFGTSLSKIRARMGEVPSNQFFDIYLANYHNGSGNKQVMLSTVYQEPATLSLTKLSSDSAVTDGNGAYDLTGSQYGV